MRVPVEIERDLLRKINAVVTDYDPMVPKLDYRECAEVAGKIWMHYVSRRYGIAFAACLDRTPDVRFFAIAALIAEAVEAYGYSTDVLE